ncbi:Uncharacterised protein [Legionella steigerwaltii]|uniref:Uncharacterized protein n=1 Tax=Legionella steigerwaltii TaxID=460 RepID=A0A378L876_9GAMM|nr:hypothetical protein [Legionella steigerwaltii]KTD76061.1 hypothetical protein Lstg_2349 [Legionella steigerwaltii]STY22122.1 Uncharacterised protein [Legionella steigerwaltii]
MGRIFQEKQENVSRVIGDFAKAETKIDALCKKIDLLQNKLYEVKTREEFDAVVQELIKEGKEIHQFLTKLLMGTNQEIISRVMVHLASRPDFKKIELLLNYTEHVTKSIVAKNELLSVQDSLADLTSVQKTSLLLFITKLKELKLVAEFLVKQEEGFKERLKQATSLDTVDIIEGEIENKNRLLDGAAERFIPFPEDELVAGKIINILKENTHLLTILQSFDLHETLMNDLLNARARIITNTDFPSSALPTP